jgi:RNA polymerase sigma factor (TIGR02999 family)
MIESTVPESKPQGADALFSEVYERLHSMASRQRARGDANQTLSTTELVHELYLSMGSHGEKWFAHPEQFFAYAARAMRNILIDLARKRLTLKAGSDQRRMALTDPEIGAVEVDPHQAIQLDSVLRALEADDARAAQVVELHFFAGLDLEQVAQVLGVHRRTVNRDWRYARAFMTAQFDQ